jgi:hypothetical protein
MAPNLKPKDLSEKLNSTPAFGCVRVLELVISPVDTTWKNIDKRQRDRKLFRG